MWKAPRRDADTFLHSWLTLVGYTLRLMSRTTWQLACTANWRLTAGNQRTSLSKNAKRHVYLQLLTIYSDEHYKRSPNCAFFLLSAESEPAPKKTARGKVSRASKTSRLSTQSVQSVAASVADTTAAEPAAEPEDSVLTTTSMAQGKKPRAKKATTKTAKGGRKKTKKESAPADDASDAGDESEVISKPPPKTTRGKKRGSEAVDDSVMSTASAPAPKKRATKARASAAESVASQDTAVPDAPAPAKAKGGRQSKARKPSATTANKSVASLRAATPEAFPDDDEIERQLEADLERQLTEDEFVYEYRRPSVQPETKPTKQAKSAAYEMLDPAPSEAGDAEVDQELQALQDEMEIDEPEKELKVAKKGRKATGTRKVSKQTKAKKVKEPTPPPPSPSPPPIVESIESEAEEQDDDSIISTETVVKNADSVDSMTEKRGRARNRDSSVASEDSVDMVTYVEPEETPVKSGRTRATEVEESPEPSPSPSPGPDAQLTSEANFATGRHADADLLAANDDDEVHIAEDPVDTSPVATSLAEPPSTPGHTISPSASAKQAVLSPSQSPQSSDAENQPPSSRPSASTKRIALAPLTATPSRMSPSKRNVIAGLQSTTPWSSVNLDAIFGTPKARADKENGVERLLKQGKELSSPEKQMTVEEWIYFNAGEAEKKLKHECERMVGLFESEGTRAMNVLEGLATE